jgi:hypothetical protein
MRKSRPPTAKATARKKNHAAIKALLDEVSADIAWFTSAEGFSVIDDKDTVPATILARIIAGILHRVAEHGFNYRATILAATLQFAAENGTDSKVWDDLDDLIKIRLKDISQ